MTDSDPARDTQSDLQQDASPVVLSDTSETELTNLNEVLAAAEKERKKGIARLAKTFGHIPGIEVGASWPTRLECSNAGVHRPTLAGIAGTKDDGAYSIVLSNMYDDSDCGETIIYTGAGGRKHWSDSFPPKRLRCGPQICDQKWTDWGNTPLLVSEETRRPVRVVRGHREVSKYAPVDGYRYDGLYTVVSHWIEENTKGLKVCRYRLERIPGQPPIPERGPVAVWRLTRRDRSDLAFHRPAPYVPPRPVPSNSHSREQTLVPDSENQPQQPMAATAVPHELSPLSASMWEIGLPPSRDDESSMDEDEEVKPADMKRLSTESVDFGPISSASRAPSPRIPLKQHNSTSPEPTPSRESSMKPELENEEEEYMSFLHVAGSVV